jgi:hypothetical protein
MSGFNYSKWDNIELSDDEDDVHPNIDKESLFRFIISEQISPTCIFAFISLITIETTPPHSPFSLHPKDGQGQPTH